MTVLLMAIIIVVTLILLNKIATERSLEGRPLELRRLPAIDAIDEAIGRAAELGKAVLWHAGSYTRLSDWSSIGASAALSVLSYVARKTASLGVDLMCGMKWAEMYPVVIETVREAYQLENKLDTLQIDEVVRYVSDDHYATFTGWLGIIRREQPAALIFIGVMGIDGLWYPESMSRHGGITIAGSQLERQVPRIVAAADYSLICEEVFAVGGYISKDPIQTASVLTMDVMRFVIMTIFLFGIILSLLGFPVIEWLSS